VAFLHDPKVKDLQLRADYQELVELTLLVLGQTPQEIHWRAAGAIHHARWMAKLLCAIKIYLFRGQTDVFKLTKKEETAIERFVHFGAMLYTMPWMKAMMATEAPGRAGLRHVRRVRLNRSANFRGPPFWTLKKNYCRPINYVVLSFFLNVSTVPSFLCQVSAGTYFRDKGSETESLLTE